MPLPSFILDPTAWLGNNLSLLTNHNNQCDGHRPICGRCSHKGLECKYLTDEGETRTLAIKRKYSFLKDEVHQLRELINYIRTTSDEDARAVFDRIRLSSDPADALRAVRNAGTLLPRAVSESSSGGDPRLEQLEFEAFQTSPIKVTAQPWTTVAGDGIVSELVSHFFAYDDAYFFSAIHREAFLDDMRTQRPEKAKFCSPLLVNAICAIRSVSLTGASKQKCYSFCYFFYF